MSYTGKHVGFIGGGQLARMAIYRTKKLGLKFSALDPDPFCGVAGLVDRLIVGSLHDPVKLRELARTVDVMTYDIEHVGVDALIELETEGFEIHPSPRLLAAVQDKLIQKNLFLDNGLPVAPKVEKSLDELSGSDYPVVQKTRYGGYDGRGVAVFRTALDRENSLPGSTFLEAWIPFERELAVMVARGRDGKTVTYPAVEMIFDSELNICDEILAPARVSPSIARRAQELALEAVRVLNGVGVFGVELFLTPEDELIINEVAHRPHNSGHYTMETCRVCQFENHLRAVCGLPLGEPGFFSSAAMGNLLGTSTGNAVVEGLESALTVPGFSIHLYGKSVCRTGRKMGHFTIVAPTPGEALAQVRSVKRYLKVTGV